MSGNLIFSVKMSDILIGICNFFKEYCYTLITLFMQFELTFAIFTRCSVFAYSIILIL